MGVRSLTRVTCHPPLEFQPCQIADSNSWRPVCGQGPPPLAPVLVLNIPLLFSYSASHTGFFRSSTPAVTGGQGKCLIEFETNCDIQFGFILIFVLRLVYFRLFKGFLSSTPLVQPLSPVWLHHFLMSIIIFILLSSPLPSSSTSSSSSSSTPPSS